MNLMISETALRLTPAAADDNVAVVTSGVNFT